MKERIDKLLDNRIVRILVLILITVIACMPLFFQGIEGHFGQDMGFHLNRIEGIVTELKAGHFPVRMESNWMEGYSYPVSIYYGDVLLYFPAFLRLLGIPVVGAYKCYVIVITFLTALFAYICFKKITKRVDIGLICGLIYTLASYRLVNVYIRGAVGEYSAMMFFPIVLLAIYNIYKRDNSDIKKQLINASLLTLGISGLINTHMLSVEMVGIVLIVFCIINIKKTFTKSVLITYVLAGVEIVIVNLFYIVPFVDYFLNEDVNINNTVGNARLIQESGLRILEYVSFFKMPFANIEVAGDDRLLLTPGIVYLAILIAGIVFWIMGKTNREMKITIVAAVVLLFITSCYFPWDFLSSNTRIGDFLAQVQFPWRYMGIIIMLLTLLGARIIERIESGVVTLSIYCAIVLISVVTVIWFSAEYKIYGELKTYEEASDLDSSDMGFIEYLRSDTVREEFTNSVQTTGDISVKEIKRNGTDREYEVISMGDSTVTLPVVNYRGYKVYDDDGNIIDIYDGNNNLIAFNINQPYNGKIYLEFVQPLYWIIAEIISAIGIVIIIIISVCATRKNKEKTK